MPWTYQEEENVLARVKLKVALLWHLHVGLVALRVQEEVDVDAWQIGVVGLVALAGPDWHGLLALEAEVIEALHELDECLLRGHGQAHTIIEDHLLITLCEALLSELYVVGVDGPVRLIGRLVGPHDLLSFLRVFLEIIATEGDVTRALTIVGKVNTEDLIELGVEVLVCLELGDETGDTVVHWVLEVGTLSWRRRHADQTRSLQALQILTPDNCEEIELGHARVGVLAETALVFRRMSEDSSFTVLKHLTSFLIHLEVF